MCIRYTFLSFLITDGLSVLAVPIDSGKRLRGRRIIETNETIQRIIFVTLNATIVLISVSIDHGQEAQNSQQSSYESISEQMANSRRSFSRFLTRHITRLYFNRPRCYLQNEDLVQSTFIILLPFASLFLIRLYFLRYLPSREFSIFFTACLYFTIDKFLRIIAENDARWMNNRC